MFNFTLTQDCVLHYSCFLSGKRSGRSKKWKEMLKLPPVSHCEGIRCSIGECPGEHSFSSGRPGEEFGAVNGKGSVLLLNAK